MDQLVVQDHVEVDRRERTDSAGDYVKEPPDTRREIIDVLQKAYGDLQHILENTSNDPRTTCATLKSDGVTVAAKQLIEICSNIIEQFQPEVFNEGCLPNKRISALLKRDSGISSTRGSVCSSNASNFPDMDIESSALQSGKVNEDIADNWPDDKKEEPSGVSFYLGDRIRVLQEEMYKLSVASTTDGKVCFAFKPSTARCDRPVFICTNEEEEWNIFNDLDRTAEDCDRKLNELNRTPEENTEPSECDNTSRQTSIDSVGSVCSRCGRRPSIMLASIYATCDLK